MPSPLKRVKAAISELQQGRMVILSDATHRENEGDLILPAELANAERINFMIRHGTGIVCTAITAERASVLNLPLMVAPNQNACARGTQFTVSVDMKEGITTGVSAADRAKTIQHLVNDKANAEDFVRPGHIFPLIARSGGVLERPGHTEGSIDLVKLAGLKSTTVLCEIMNPDGSMAKGDELEAFANQHQIMSLSIDDLISYRTLHEETVQIEATARLPLTHYGDFTLHVIREIYTQKEHVVLMKEGTQHNQPILTRIHSSCMTGDLFSSLRCDCHQQLHYALEQISQRGGVLIYLNQEGRGIGLINKIKAYALQEKGLDTVSANEALGLPVDLRSYYTASAILRALNISHIKLLTNNPNKINDLIKNGMINVQRENMPAFDNSHNRFYLKTKQLKLQHEIHLP